MKQWERTLVTQHDMNLNLQNTCKIQELPCTLCMWEVEARRLLGLSGSQPSSKCGEKTLSQGNKAKSAKGGLHVFFSDHCMLPHMCPQIHTLL